MNSHATGLSRELVEFGVSVSTCAGEQVCGDHHLIASCAGSTLIAIADGGGHGAEAAQASKLALCTMQTHLSNDLGSLVKRCHEALRRTRGAAIGVARVDWTSGTLSWLGVGNIVGVLIRRTEAEGARAEPLLVRAGCVGYRLPGLHCAVAAISSGDLLVMATDGLSHGFADPLTNACIANMHPERIAEWIMTRYAKPGDDALVLAARFLAQGA
jgi:hypothetical protein